MPSEAWALLAVGIASALLALYGLACERHEARREARRRARHQ